MPVDSTVEQWRGTVDIQDVGCQALLKQIFQSFLTLILLHLFVVNVGIVLQAYRVYFAGLVGVEDIFVLVPLAEEMQWCSSLTVLHVEIGVDPLHEYFQ